MSDDESARSLQATRQRVAVQSFGLALLMAAIATLSIVIFKGQFHGLHLFRAQARASGTASVHAPSLAHDQILVKVAPESDAAEEPPKNRAAAARHLSATELFALANQARQNGDLAGAIATSEQIEQWFPSSPEGITTHLTLGVIYMQQGKPNLALGEFEIYRHIGNPDLMAEALWGQAQALKQLARPSDEREILTELLKSYPRSVYVAAAKERLNGLPAAEH